MELVPYNPQLPTKGDSDEPILTGELSPNTQRAYLADIKEFFGAKNVREITREMIQSIGIKEAMDYHGDLVQKIRDGKLAPSTVARKLCSMRHLYDLMIELEVVQRNPFRSKAVRPPRVDAEGLTSGLTKEASEQLLRSIDRTRLIGKRDFAIIALGIFNALRRDEIATLKWGNLKQERRYDVVEVVGKGSKKAVLKLKPLVVEAIHEYVEATGRHMTDSEPVFLSHGRNHLRTQKAGYGMSTEAIRLMLTRRCRQAKVKRITPHDMRRTSITIALDSGANLTLVQDHARHASPVTTRRYDINRNRLDHAAVDYINLDVTLDNEAK